MIYILHRSPKGSSAVTLNILRLPSSPTTPPSHITDRLLTMLACFLGSAASLWGEGPFRPPLYSGGPNAFRPMGAQSGPKEGPGVQKGARGGQRSPKGGPRAPRGGQREPKGFPGRPLRSTLASLGQGKTGAALEKNCHGFTFLCDTSRIHEKVFIGNDVSLGGAGIEMLRSGIFSLVFLDGIFFHAVPRYNII